MPVKNQGSHVGALFLLFRPRGFELLTLNLKCSRHSRIRIPCKSKNPLASFLYLPLLTLHTKSCQRPKIVEAVSELGATDTFGRFDNALTLDFDRFFSPPNLTARLVEKIKLREHKQIFIEGGAEQLRQNPLRGIAVFRQIVTKRKAHLMRRCGGKFFHEDASHAPRVLEVPLTTVTYLHSMEQLREIVHLHDL